jgi:hypothetical protein
MIFGCCSFWTLQAQEGLILAASQKGEEGQEADEAAVQWCSGDGHRDLRFEKWGKRWAADLRRPYLRRESARGNIGPGEV